MKVVKQNNMKKSLWLDEMSLSFNCSNWVKQAGQSVQWFLENRDQVYLMTKWEHMIGGSQLSIISTWCLAGHVGTIGTYDLWTLMSQCGATLIRETCPLTTWSSWPWSLRRWCGSRRSSANLHWSGKRRCFDHASLPMATVQGCQGPSC